MQAEVVQSLDPVRFDMSITLTAIISIVSGAIIAIAWLLRLEAATKNNAKEIQRLADEAKEISAKIDDTRTRFFDHAANVAVHHNAAAEMEFKAALEKRFSGVEKTLSGIENKLDRLASKSWGQA